MNQQNIGGMSRQVLADLWQSLQDTALRDPENPPYVRLAQALALIPKNPAEPPHPFGKGETDRFEEGDGFAAGIDVEMWFSRIQVYGNTAGEAEAMRDHLLEALAVFDGVKHEPVAIIGECFSLLWASGESLLRTVQRTGLKVGDKLYRHPPEPEAGELDRLRLQLAQATALLSGWVDCDTEDELKDLNEKSAAFIRGEYPQEQKA